KYVLLDCCPRFPNCANVLANVTTTKYSPRPAGARNRAVITDAAKPIAICAPRVAMVSNTAASSRQQRRSPGVSIGPTAAVGASGDGSRSNQCGTLRPRVPGGAEYSGDALPHLRTHQRP